MIVAVTDTGPLFHLAAIDSLEVYSVLDTVLVPKTVYNELEPGGLPPNFAELDYELVEGNNNESTWSDSCLDAGEVSALAVSSERDGILLTDDLEARHAAKNAGIEVHGSIDLIALAYRGGKIDRAIATERMRALQNETSLFITDAVLESGIELLESDE